jgi:hypothetical protein
LHYHIVRARLKLSFKNKYKKQKGIRMYHHKLDSRGIGHYIIIGGVAAAVAIGGVGFAVLNASHNQDQSHVGLNSKSAVDKKLLIKTVDAQGNLHTAPTTPAPSPVPSSSQSTIAPTTTTKSATAPSKTAPNTQAPAPAPTTQSAPAPAASPSPQTPYQALSDLVTNVYNGVEANVTSVSVTVAGPITNAQARPIVFAVNGKTYLAYRQGQAPNFTTTPSQTASSMAIIEANKSYSVVSAHLDKSANFVDIDFKLVGFSTGGN